MFVGKLCLVFLAPVVLGLANAEGESSPSYLDKCPKFHIRKSTIIKTQKSVRDGAEFLGKKVMRSSRGCHEQCCKTKGCNLVMLKYDTELNSVEKVSCFMFNCRSPSVCSFFEHASYHSYAALEFEDIRKPQYSSKNYRKTEDYKQACETVGFKGFCRASLEDALANSDGLCAEFLQDLQSDCVANATLSNVQQAGELQNSIRDKCEDLCGEGTCQFFDVAPGDCASSRTVYYHAMYGSISTCLSMEFMGCLGVENKFDSKQECEMKCINNNVALNKREKICPATMEWTECGSACPLTCSNLNSHQITCLSGCVDGCHCPTGLWKDGNRCVPRNKCSCNHAGIYYKHGSVRRSACEECTCEGGSWDCIKLKCGGTCSYYGNSHIRTFDGKYYDMRGKCEYVLSKHCHSPSGSEFEIRLLYKNFPKCRSIGSNCDKEFEIRVGGSVIVLKKYPLLTVDGKKKDLQIGFPGMKNVAVRATKANIYILWTGENLFLVVDSSFFKQTCGLCGTFDNDMSNDFHTHDDDNEISTETFASQWLLPESKCVEEKWSDGKYCEFYYERKVDATERCKILKEDEAFQDCHKFVSPDIYYEHCLSDACVTRDGYLEVVHAYIKMCADEGVVINWWKPKT